MIKNILVTNYTNSGFTQDDAEKIVTVLKAELPNLSDGDALSFDFSNVKFFTTLSRVCLKKCLLKSTVKNSAGKFVGSRGKSL